MRLKTLLRSLAAFAALPLLGACSSDAPDSSGNEVGNGEKYIAIQLCNVSNTRAEERGPFEDGVGTENDLTAKNTYFFFFDEDGKPYTMEGTSQINGTASNTNVVQPQAIGTETTDGTQVTSAGVLVLGKPSEGYIGGQPEYVICLANPGANFELAKVANMTIEEFGQKLSSDVNSDSSVFTMINSTYIDKIDGNDVVIFATSCKGKFKSSAVEAQNDAVQIYIERLLAKVRVSNLENVVVKDKDNNNAKFDIFKLDNGNVVKESDVELSVNLLGWQLYSATNKAYLAKNLKKDNDIIDDPFSNWNNANYHRSYWELTSEIEATDSYNIYPEEDNTDFQYGSFSIAEGKSRNEVYTFPNTYYSEKPESTSDRSTKATAIVVKGQVNKNNTAIDLVFWGGAYYYLDAFKQTVADTYNTYKDDNAASISASDVVLDQNKDENAIANTWIVKVGNNTLSDFKNIKYWKNGYTSYFINIEHAKYTNDENEEVTVYGVVRNHIYDTTIEKVIGLGVPGNDPVNPKDEKETYLAARINVLNWRVVSNKVTLE